MVKVGLFGAGYLGKTHIDNWQKIQEATLTGFYEPNDETAKEITDTYNLRRFYNEDELIDSCDAIDVVSPIPLHFAICEKAIRKGKHVFVEKPITHTVAEAQQLVKLVQESNVKLQVGHKEQFNPAFLAAKEHAHNPLLIEAYRLESPRPDAPNVNIIMDLMIHDINAILSIVNSDVKHISANGVSVLSETPDIANVRIEFYNGCTATLTSSRIAKRDRHTMHLFQKDAHIEIDFLHQSAERFTTKGVEAIYEAGKANLQQPEINAIKTELQAFLEAIENNAQPVINEIDGLRTLEVTHQILQKINQNFSLT